MLFLSNLIAKPLGYNVKPIDVLSEKDTGDETLRRYRYQHTCTAYIGLLMYKKVLQYREVFCELHEDILCLCNNGMFHGIQIKTRQLSDGPFFLDDEQVKKSITRFLQLDEQFPNHFEKFIFICNCDFVQNDTGRSIYKLQEQLSYAKGGDFKFQPRTLDSYISYFEKQFNYDRKDMIDFLKKIEFQKMPDIDDIDSKIITDVLSEIEGCGNLSTERLKVVLDNIILTIYNASSKKSKNPVKDYISLMDNRLNVAIEADVNTKRITSEMIETVIKKQGSKVFYLADDEEFKLSDDRKNRMKHKMNYAYIDPDMIESMNELREKAEDYFLMNHYKSDNKKELTHLLSEEIAY